MPDEIADPAAWRCFIALEATDEIREGIARLQEKLRRTGAHLSLPNPALTHLTLLFLGDVLYGQVNDVSVMMDRAAAEHFPFTWRAAGAGFFGPPSAPRVVWAGVEPSPPMLALQGALAEGARVMGFRVEDRPFHPHLTLARVKSLRNVAELTSLLPSIKSVRLGETPAARVLLMRSHLDQPNVRYSLLHASPLKGT